jgi:hypothetical protein
MTLWLTSNLRKKRSTARSRGQSTSCDYAKAALGSGAFGAMEAAGIEPA